MNQAAEEPDFVPPTVEEKQAARELAKEVLTAVTESRLFGAPVIMEFGPTYTKLICPKRNDEGLPRTMILVNTDKSLTVRHPHDCAGDTMRRPLQFAPEQYAGQDLGAFAVAAVKQLHDVQPNVASSPSLKR